MGRSVDVGTVEHPNSPTFGAVIGYSERDKQIYIYCSILFITYQIKINLE